MTVNKLAVLRGVKLAAARADTERLDWLLDHRLQTVGCTSEGWYVLDLETGTGEFVALDEPTARDAIDAAMAKQKGAS